MTFLTRCLPNFIDSGECLIAICVIADSSTLSPTQPIKRFLWHKLKTNNQEAVQTGFYGKTQARDIADIFRFVNQQCGFLSAFTPTLQPR